MSKKSASKALAAVVAADPANYTENSRITTTTTKKHGKAAPPKQTLTETMYE